MTQIVEYAALEWAVPPGGESDAGVLRRARIIEGAGGFHSHVIDCPPGYVLPPHSHDHGELFVVLEGSAIVGDRTLTPFDTIAIAANEVYGLAAGPEGLTFMIVRSGRASLEMK